MVVIKFLKNWTLPIAIVVGIILYFIFHLVPFLSPIAEWYAPYNGNVLPDFMTGPAEFVFEGEIQIP